MTAIEVTYPYRRLDGGLAYEVVRRPGKKFVQRQPQPGDGWKWDLDGVERVPYNWPALDRAANEGGTAWVTEGEKDCDRLVEMGLVAATNSGGTGWPWPVSWAEYFRGYAQVVVLVDNDAPGRKAARQRAEVIATAVRDVRLLELPDLDVGGDVSDWLNAGGSLDDLWKLADAARQVTADAARQVTAEPRESNGHAGHLVAALGKTQLPEDWWRSRPVLAGIRQAARARLVAPDAVLGAVLARVAACVPHTIELPAIVGSPVGLTFYTTVTGAPETGKSAATALAAELVPAPANVLDGLPIGSGEGMTECLFELVEETDENGKARKVKRQTRHAAVFHVDEGGVVAELGGRRGSTLLATLRAAWTHSTIGNTNANIETRRVLAGQNYTYGVVVGLQPELAGPLLADAAGGLPQRFLWVSASDPAAPEVPEGWPGLLGWQPPTAAALEPLTVTRGGWRRHVLPVAPSVVAVVRAARLAVVRGEVQVAALDAHRNLLRLKVAALLSLLDERLGVSEEDWALAGVAVDTSRRVRASVEAVLEGAQRRREDAATERVARREMTVDDAKSERAMASASRSVARVAVRHAEGDQHIAQGGGCTRNCFTMAISSKHRALVSTVEAIEAAEREGWVTPAEDRWIPGKSRPA